MAKGNTALAAYKAGERARSRKGGGHKSKRISLAMVAGFVPLGMEVVNAYKTEPDDFIARAGHNVTAALTGYDTYDHKFHLGHMKNGTLPIIAGALVHKMAGKFGINRMIAQAGIPWISI